MSYLKLALDRFAQYHDPSESGASYPHYKRAPQKLGAYGAAIYLTAPEEIRRKRKGVWEYVWSEIEREQAGFIAKYLKETSEATGKDQGVILDRLREGTFKWTKKLIKQRYQPYSKVLDGTIAQAVEHYKRGSHGAQWYQGVYEKIVEIFGPGPEGADLFIDLLAATSPQTKVYDNVIYALRAWEEIKLDLDWSEWSASPNIRPNLNRSIDMSEGKHAPLSGPKVYNFRKALQGDPTAVTIDRWMIRALLGDEYAGHDQTSISDIDYFFLDQLTREVARVVNDDPINVGENQIVTYAEMQAAMWAGYRMQDPSNQDTRTVDIGEGTDYFPDILNWMLTEANPLGTDDKMLSETFQRNPDFWMPFFEAAAAQSGVTTPSMPQPVDDEFSDFFDGLEDTPAPTPEAPWVEQSEPYYANDRSRMVQEILDYGYDAGLWRRQPKHKKRPSSSEHKSSASRC